MSLKRLWEEISSYSDSNPFVTHLTLAILGLAISSSLAFTAYKTLARPGAIMDQPTEGQTVSGVFQFQAFTGDSSLEFVIDGSLTVAATNPEPGFFVYSTNTTGLEDGPHDVFAHTPSFGNSATVNFTVNNGGGGGGGGGEVLVQMVQPSTDEVVSGDSAIFAASVTGGMATSVHFIVNGEFTITATEAGEGAWVYSYNSTNIPDGNYSVIARAAVDGQTIDSDPVPFSINNASGGGGDVIVSISQPQPNDNVTSTRYISVSVLNGEPDQVLLSINGSSETHDMQLDGSPSPDITEWSFPIDLDTDLWPNGEYSITVTAYDNGEAIGTDFVIFNVIRSTESTCQDDICLTKPIDESISRACSIELAAVVPEIEPTSVDFVVTHGEETETISASKSAGVWQATYASEYTGVQSVIARLTSRSGSLDTDPRSFQLNMNGTCSGTPVSADGLNVYFYTPNNNSTLTKSPSSLTTYSFPVASRVTYEIYSVEAGGLPTALPATKGDNGMWSAEWDLSSVNNGTYDIVAIALNDKGSAFRQTIRVNVNKEEAASASLENTSSTGVLEGTTSTSSTVPIVPLTNDLALFDESVTGTYSAMQSSAANPTIDVGMGIKRVTGPTLCRPGMLLKLEDDHNPRTVFDAAVYYCAADGKRYAFPNDKIFFSWYTDFSEVESVPVTIMSNIPLGGNVVYRPGFRMIKIQTDPKVYAVTRGSILRWITSEAVAKKVYGEDWNTLVDDVSDAFFTNYAIGKPITE
jgi:hypothetical protein